jgi:hypothetical protein
VCGGTGYIQNSVLVIDLPETKSRVEKTALQPRQVNNPAKAQLKHQTVQELAKRLNTSYQPSSAETSTDDGCDSSVEANAGAR